MKYEWTFFGADEKPECVVSVDLSGRGSLALSITRSTASTSSLSSGAFSLGIEGEDDRVMWRKRCEEAEVSYEDGGVSIKWGHWRGFLFHQSSKSRNA